jgi:sodium transport system permease protein
MNIANVRLILHREVRDQLRDRRTLFMIFVLPILLYPLLGTCFFQVAQFRQEKPTRVVVTGAKQLSGLPPLFEHQRIAGSLFDADEVQQTELLQLEFLPDEPRQSPSRAWTIPAEVRRQVEAGQCDAALCFPPDFAARIAAPNAKGESPRLELPHTTTTDKSLIAINRLKEVLQRWGERIVAARLSASGVSPAMAQPFVLQPIDLASHHGAIAWSKILPVLLLVWALTGAFYPAIDLCAGEKERGTMETLLCSPARRSEIVLGKLLTIMLFSMITAMLNLLSIGLTGALLLAGRMQGFSAPPALAIVWLAFALVPLSALFSALSLALAAFARSTKEGQYYLMPLLLVTMPLTILSTMPGMELNLGTSLIPITGMVLLLRSTLVGSYWPVVPFILPVLCVTLLCCLLAIRWAVEQFNSETVLFRESERLDMGLWLRHLMRDREATPTVAGAVFCGVVILLVKFFMGLVIAMPSGFHDFAVVAVITQLAVILTPVLLMTTVLANKPRQTLLLNWPRWTTLPAAVLLAVALHPGVVWLQGVVFRLYPLNPEVKKALDGLLGGSPNLIALLVVMAVVPPVCEELAFRGFILSGFRHLGHAWRAVVYSALFFGLTHPIMQQSILASLVGVVIGVLAVRTGSILPCIVFHMTHNALAVLSAHVETLRNYVPAVRSLVSPDGNYDWTVVAGGTALAAMLLAWFLRLPYAKSGEEALQSAIRTQNRPLASVACPVIQD